MNMLRLVTAIWCFVASSAEGSTIRSNSTDGSCDFNGDMCAISTSCLAKYEFTRPCSFMTHSAIYKASKPSQFRIKLHRELPSRKLYPDLMKVSVVRVREGSLTQTESCCDLGEDRDCTLPPINLENERYVVFAPFYNEGMVQEYCHLEVVYQSIRSWCLEDPNPPCIYIKNGTLLVNDSYIALSFLQHLSRIDYCVFHAPSHYLHDSSPLVSSLSKPNSKFSLRIIDNTVYGNDFSTTCKRIKTTTYFNLTETLIVANVVPEHVVCTFFHVAEYNQDWDATPICLSEPGHSDPNYMVLAIASVTAVICCLSICVTMRYICKHVQKKGLARKIHMPSTFLAQIMWPWDGSSPLDKGNDRQCCEESHGRYVAVLQQPQIPFYDAPPGDEEIVTAPRRELPLLSSESDGDLTTKHMPDQSALAISPQSDEDDVIVMLSPSTPSNHYIPSLDSSTETIDHSAYIAKF